LDAKGHNYKMKCYGSTTLGERGQLVLPVEARKMFGIKPGDKLIVFAADAGDFQKVVLMKAEAVTKMFEHLLDMEKLLEKGPKKDLEELQKKGLKKMKVALKKSGVKGLKKMK